MRIHWLCGSAFFLAGGCFVPEATIESTTSSGSSGSSMETSTVSSGTGMDPRAWSPTVTGPTKFGPEGGNSEIARTGEPMQRHIVDVMAKEGAGSWFLFYLNGHNLEWSSYDDMGQWKTPAGSVSIDAATIFDDGRSFGVYADPQTNAVDVAVDWSGGAFHLQGTATKNPLDLEFMPRVDHGVPGQNADEAAPVSLKMKSSGELLDFTSLEVNGTACMSCVASHSAANGWTQKPLDFTSPLVAGFSPRGAAQANGRPVVAWPREGGLAHAHRESEPDAWFGSDINNTSAVKPGLRNWGMCTRFRSPPAEDEVHALVANSSGPFTHLVFGTSGWDVFDKAALAPPSASEVTEFFLACNQDSMFAFTITEDGEVMGSRYDFASDFWSYWVSLASAPASGLKRCWLSGFDQASTTAGIIFTEADDCTKKTANQSYVLFVRFG